MKKKRCSLSLHFCFDWKLHLLRCSSTAVRFLWSGISQDFSAITFPPPNALTKHTLARTPDSFCHNRQAVIADNAEGEASLILGSCLHVRHIPNRFIKQVGVKHQPRKLKLPILDSNISELNWMVYGHNELREPVLPATSINKIEMWCFLLRQAP